MKPSQSFKPTPSFGLGLNVALKSAGYKERTIYSNTLTVKDASYVTVRRVEITAYSHHEVMQRRNAAWEELCREFPDCHIFSNWKTE